jgi:hypothetical protein
MSNCFRTPIIDPIRNLTRSIFPQCEVFSLRLRRSSVRTLYHYYGLRQRVVSGSAPLGSLIDFVASTRPGIVGRGLWFRTWSKWLENDLKRFLNNRPSDQLVHASPYFSPIDALSVRSGVSTDSLTSSMDAFRRVMAAVYFKFPKLYFPPNQVKGLEFQKRRLECHSPGKWGEYEIRCDGTGKEFASYIHVRATRDKILREYNTAFDAVPEFTDALVNVIRERKKFAAEFGYNSWTELQAVSSGFESEFEPLDFLSGMYKDSQPVVRSFLNAVKKKDFVPTCPTDEGYILTQFRQGLVDLKKNAKSFEYKTCFSRILSLFEKSFAVQFEPLPLSEFSHGWHPSVMAFKVVRSEQTHPIGYVYIDLFRRVSGGVTMGPHCTPLYPDNHVRVFMGIEPPYRSDVTFKKERNFTYEEVTAIMHELGHAMHLLLRPTNSPIAQLPLDMRETVSIMMELFSESNECIEHVSGCTVKSAHMFKRDPFFYIDIIRNVAVAEVIHSTKFDPFSANAAAELNSLARETFAKFTPMKVENFMNPFGGEIANYLIDGESRVGYLMSYVRAANAMTSVRDGQTDEVFAKLKNDFISREFPPFVTPAVEAQRSEIERIHHPLADENGMVIPGTNACKAFWTYVGAREQRGKVGKR